MEFLPYHPQPRMIFFCENNLLTSCCSLFSINVRVINYQHIRAHIPLLPNQPFSPPPSTMPLSVTIPQSSYTPLPSRGSWCFWFATRHKISHKGKILCCDCPSKSRADLQVLPGSSPGDVAGGPGTRGGETGGGTRVLPQTDLPSHQVPGRPGRVEGWAEEVMAGDRVAPYLRYKHALWNVDHLYHEICPHFQSSK